MAKMETFCCGERKESFKIDKKQTIRAAKELCYSDEVINKLKSAKDSHELTRIMVDARKRGRSYE